MDDELNIDDFLLVDVVEEVEPPGIVSRLFSWIPFWGKPNVPQALPEDFSSATKLRAHIRNIVLEFGECRSVRSKSEETYLFLLSLYSYHPSQPKDVIDFAIVRGSYGNLHFSVIKQTTSYSLSWLKCVESIPKFASRKPNPEAIKRKQLASAMRTAIAYQVNKLKQESVYTCVLCGLKGDKSGEFHVDHDVIPFCKLMDEFISGWPSSLPERFEYNKGRIQISVMDRPFEIAWAAFHEKNAKLQILCKTCNLKKGKKI